MDRKEAARRTTTVAHALLVLSLFSVLVWWRLGAYLFAAGCLGVAAKWMLDDTSTSHPLTVPE